MTRVSLTKLVALPTFVLVGLFTVCDLIAGGFYWLYLQETLTSRFFNLSRDRGFAEIIQYFKFVVVIAILLRWYKTRPAYILKAWAIFFLALLLDDSLGIHEFIGKMLVPFITFELPLGMRAKDIAELAGFALVEGLALAYVFFYVLTAERDLRWYSLCLFCALIPLISAGMILDNLPFEFLEQVGEMLGGSIILAYVHWYYRKHA